MENKDLKNNFNHPAVIVTILNTPDPQQAEIDALKKTVEDLKNQKPQTIIKEVPAKSTSITDIVNEWGPVIPIVVCNFRNSNGIIVESQGGSAILASGAKNLQPRTQFGIVTNKHIVTNSIGNFANDCQIQFPNDPQIFTSLTSDISTSDTNGADGALMKINSPNPDSILSELLNNSKKKFCSSIPNIGDEVVILGYPAIGASSGVTATEGIISGYDGDYYVTSAKVDHGNSGGAAIDVKNNCDLGIPTYVISGQLESLARILKWKVIVPVNEQQSVATYKL